MLREIKGAHDAKGFKFALVASRFNDAVVARLVQGAVDCFVRHGADESDLTLVRVPGSFELPQVARQLALSKRFDAIVCLGALVRGETPHFEYISSAVSHGLTEAAGATGVPMTFGVLTTNSVEEALERAGDGPSNKGWEAATAAVEMATIFGKMKQHA